MPPVFKPNQGTQSTTTSPGLYPQFTIKTEPRPDNPNIIPLVRPVPNTNNTQTITRLNMRETTRSASEETLFNIEAAAHCAGASYRTYSNQALLPAQAELQMMFKVRLQRERLPINDPPGLQQQLQQNPHAMLHRDLGYPAVQENGLDDVMRNPIYSAEQQRVFVASQAQKKTPVFSMNKRRYYNPLKQPSQYSQYTPLSHEQHCKSNSTSSLFSHLFAVPPLQDVISGTATLLATHIMNDVNSNLVAQYTLPFAPKFEEKTYTNQPVPMVEKIGDVEAFIKHCYDMGKFQPETLVVTLIFINRFLAHSGLQLSHGNWKPLFIGALILSQKICDDTPLINKDFGIIYPALADVHNINAIEGIMIKVLEFDLHITSANYCCYLEDIINVSRQTEAKTNLYQLQYQTWMRACEYSDSKPFPERLVVVNDEIIDKYLTEQQQLLQQNNNNNNNNNKNDNDPQQQQQQQQQQRLQQQSNLDISTDLDHIPITNANHIAWVRDPRPTPINLTEILPPLIGRSEQHRMHFTDLYSYQRQFWKRQVMTVEGLWLADNKYKVIS